MTLAGYRVPMAFSLLIGFCALSQVPNGLSVGGIVLVVAAGIGAERSGARNETPAETGSAGGVALSQA